MAQEDSTPRVFVPFGTLLLLAVVLGVFLVEWHLAPAPEASKWDFSPPTMARLGGLVPMYVDAGQWWRFFTAPLLHQSFGAIAGNGLLLALSGFVERRIGWRWYLLTFAVSASIGTAASYLRLPPNVVATGASGGILGLFAAGLIRSLFAPDDMRKGLATTCALALALGFLPGGHGTFVVDRVAHIAGMIAGGAMGLLIVAHFNPETAMPKRATAVVLALGAYAAMTVASFALDAIAPSADRSAAVPTASSTPSSSPPLAPAPTAPRTAIPVGLRVLEDQGGERVYFILARFGMLGIDTVLDTEDSATLILPGRALGPGFAPTSTTFAMTYGSGATYDSQIVRGQIGLYTLTGPADIGLVTRAGCAASTPKCAILDEPLLTAYFGYDAYPASLGLSPGADPAHPSVPVQLGVRRYLLTVPHRDATGHVTSGQLVFNPTDDETRGYVPLTADAAARVPGAVHGCLRNLTNAITFCGAIIFDTDFSGIEVFQQMNLPARRDWSTGDKVKLMFTGRANTQEIAGVDFTIGLSTLPVFRFGPPGLYPEPVIRIGQVPYLGLDVLTDLVTGQVSVAVRKTPEADAVGHVP